MSDYTDDAISALEFVRKRKDVNPDRVAFFGHSEGAWVALLAAQRKGDEVKALVLAGIWFAFQHPVVFLTALAVFIVLAIWLLPKLWRGLKAVFRSLKRRIKPTMR